MENIGDKKAFNIVFDNIEKTEEEMLMKNMSLDEDMDIKKINKLICLLKGEKIELAIGFVKAFIAFSQNHVKEIKSQNITSKKKY
jgi:hypothetical protein